MITRYIRILCILLVIILIPLLIVWQSRKLEDQLIHGIVMADNMPIANATVRVQGQAVYALTGDDGHFVLPIRNMDSVLHLTASAPGFYITGTTIDGIAELQLNLRPHPKRDNVDYEFIGAVLEPDNLSMCGRCHASRDETSNSYFPVDEWLQDAHSGSATNPRFLSVYNGTTLDGRQGVPTEYNYDPSSAVDIPVAPSQGQSDASVGFRLDFPGATGACANCHVPILALGPIAQSDPALGDGVAREGITCDFCHKIWDVKLAEDGKPSPHLPGVASLELLRPLPNEQVFLGPLDDTPGDDIHSPLQKRSQFCAACHTGTFWGVTMYNSFGEWLESPYNREGGKTCQDCHMPHSGATGFVQLPSDVKNYVPPRDPQTIFSHRMPGAADAALLQATADLEVETQWQDQRLVVSVRVTNTGAGHHIPTDNPLRNMILLVTVTDNNQNPLQLIRGPTLPEWSGVGDWATGHYAGLPGILFAKILTDFYTGETPTYAYWRQTRLVSDNRIPALASNQSAYEFLVPASETHFIVDVRLVFRRAFIDLMELKDWDMPDILMNQVVQDVTR